MIANKPYLNHAMRRVRSLLYPLLLSLHASVLMAATPTKTIVWFHSDFPPIFILNGPFEGRGAADQWGALLMQQLPDYRHELVAANTARLQNEMKHSDNACSSALLKTPEREKLFIFSEPIVSFLPNGLITLRSRTAELAPFLNENGEVHLNALITEGNFQIAVAAGRSFGQVIDPALQVAEKTGRRVQFNAGDVFSSGLLRLASHRGVDAVTGYAIELTWAIQRLNLDAEQFWFIPVKGETSLIPVHIACSRSPTGSTIINQANTLIRAGKLPDAAARAYAEWLPDDVKPHYERLRTSAGKQNRK